MVVIPSILPGGADICGQAVDERPGPLLVLPAGRPGWRAAP
ncbi:hypothetical protein [Ruania albidiflava]|nr:hypothetical protein [Ruania albidiflava]